MIFIVHDEPKNMGGLANGFRAVEGLEPMKLPDTMGVIDLTGITGDATIDGRTLPAFCRELNAVLGELIEAFQARDSVLIGDLMEYEMAPRLQTLRAFLNEHAVRSQA